MSTPQTPPAKPIAIEELKAFISAERDGRQVKKALAVKLIYQDYRYEAISVILDVSLGALSKWKQAYKRDGLAGFRPQHKGRPELFDLGRARGRIAVVTG